MQTPRSSAVWRAGYLTGGTAQMYQCQSTTDAWIGGGVMNPKELIVQIMTFSRPWSEWVQFPCQPTTQRHRS
ncbi:MAG: hypothetical protein DSM106950_42100 [Stigonema ocellatum SAG 48.90 = DSM 106950]|nr:hypothetical protein [Stigonema ocellatum SAG 48.90 = DSM 106950]